MDAHVRQVGAEGALHVGAHGRSRPDPSCQRGSLSPATPRISSPSMPATVGLPAVRCRWRMESLDRGAPSAVRATTGAWAGTAGRRRARSPDRRSVRTRSPAHPPAATSDDALASRARLGLRVGCASFVRRAIPAAHAFGKGRLPEGEAVGRRGRSARSAWPLPRILLGPPILTSPSPWVGEHALTKARADAGRRPDPSAKHAPRMQAWLGPVHSTPPQRRNPGCR